MNGAGRICPLSYRYGASALAQAPERQAHILYVIGGLYGNLPALDAIDALAGAESGPVTLCFNGDFNWFNVDDKGFNAINERVLRHDAILGNIEAELVSNSSEAGCGCAYPETVDACVVERSNAIHARLKRTAARHPALLAKLGGLPMFARYRVGDLRVGVVHGDADSLAGWRFDGAELDNTRDSVKDNHWRAAAFAAAGVDVFASSHTCLPAMRRFPYDGCKLIANNGAAGMPNFSATSFGVLTRIAVRTSPHQPLYGTPLKGTHIDALPINYDAQAWHESFLANWPPGSPAWQSYFNRITDGPDHVLDRALCHELTGETA